MRTTRLVMCLLLAVVLAACSGGGTPAPTTGPTSAATGTAPSSAEPSTPAPTADPVAGVSINVVYSSDSIGVNDFPTKYAWDALQARGMTVNIQFVAESELAVQALIRGDVQIAHATPPVAINANTQDPTIKAFSDYKRQSWSLASTPDIQKVEDLAGKTLAVHGETSFTKTVADLIIAEYQIPNVNVVIIPGSEVRAQALLSGQIDATVLDVQDLIQVEHQAPGAIKELLSFGQRFPDLTSGRWIADSDWVSANEAVAKEVLKAMIEANRQAVAKPDQTVADALAYYADQDPEIIETTIRTFIDNDLWTLNGSITREAAIAELKFYLDGGQTTLEATDANADRAYMLALQDAVLTEIGRQ